jgi:hypothetical protein
LPPLLPLLPDLGAEPLLEPEGVEPDDDEDEDAGGAMQVPCSHASEQQSPNLVQDAPLPLHVAFVPPHTPLTQSLLQHCAFEEHVFPSA